MQLARTKEWRESRGLTQRELAAEAGVGEATVARVETGASVAPPTARKIAGALGVSVSDLMERPPVPLADAPLSPEWALSAPDDDAFRRAIERAPTEALRGLILGLVSGYKPVLLEDARRGRRDEAFRDEASRRVKAFSRASLVGEELVRRGEEPPERYVLALKRFVDATTQAPEAGLDSAYRPRYSVPHGRPVETVEEALEGRFGSWEAYTNDFVDRWTEKLEAGEFNLGEVEECWANLEDLTRALSKENREEQDALPPQPEAYGLPAAKTGRALYRINGLFGPLHDAVRSKFGESELAKMRQKHAEQEALLGELSRRTG